MTTDDGDDPLMKPASEAGWGDEPATPAAGGEPAGGTAAGQPPVAGKPAASAPASLASKPSADQPAAATDPLAAGVGRPPVGDGSPAAIAASPEAVTGTSQPAPAGQPSTTGEPAMAGQPSTTGEPAMAGQPSVDAADAALRPDSEPTAATASEPTAGGPAVAGELAVPLAKIDAAVAKLDSKPDEPLLPAKYDENELRAAVGAKPIEPSARRRAVRDDDADEPAPRRSRKTIAVIALSATAALGIVALIFLGHINGDRYRLACEPERAVPQQGRAFPPWGMRPLEGAEWKPLKIAPETRCQPHDTDDLRTLSRAYLIMILDQATAVLSAREVTRLDDAEALLKQALLLTRPPAQDSDALATERAEHRKEVDRMLGDVTYWRATARMRDAAAALADAARQFETAAAAHPRHVSDAPAWATHARKLAGELKAGPGGLPAAPVGTAPPANHPAGPPPDKDDRTDVPVGVALPVDDAPARPPAPGSAAPPPDAGVPTTGGVLL